MYLVAQLLEVVLIHMSIVVMVDWGFSIRAAVHPLCTTWLSVNQELKPAVKAM